MTDRPGTADPGPLGSSPGEASGAPSGRPDLPPNPTGARSAPRQAGARPEVPGSGQHRTERVPFPLPVPAPDETGRLDLSGYPPVVPGAAAPTGAHEPASGSPAPAPPPAGRLRPGRRLGIDVGTVRVGVALSDPTGMLASPLETLRRAKDGSDLDRLVELVVTHEVVEVVVGLPKHLSGASGASARDASTYASALTSRIGDVPVHLVDERLSTVTAASHLRAGGIDSRRQRSVIDQAAAVVILQTYLDTVRASGGPPS
jgi:putative pre-16S rRNA nuclease